METPRKVELAAHGGEASLVPAGVAGAQVVFTTPRSKGSLERAGFFRRARKIFEQSTARLALKPTLTCFGPTGRCAFAS
jgi:hypothetical protein